MWLALPSWSGAGDGPTNRRDSRLQKLDKQLKGMDIPDDEKTKMKEAGLQKETEFLRLKRSKINVADFEFIKTIGRGAFGEVKYANALMGSTQAMRRHYAHFCRSHIRTFPHGHLLV